MSSERTSARTDIGLQNESAVPRAIPANEVAAVTVAADGVILHCNQRVAEIVQNELPTVLGCSFQTPFAGDEVANITSLVRERDDGERRLRATPLASGARPLPAAVALDDRNNEGARRVIGRDIYWGLVNRPST